MIHEFQTEGHGPKGLDPGCVCGLPLARSEFSAHKFMREWFAAHPGYGNAGTYTFRFQHWVDNGWVVR